LIDRKIPGKGDRKVVTRSKILATYHIHYRSTNW